MASSVRSKLAQLRSVSPIVLLTFTVGMSIGWASPALYKLEDKNGEKPFPVSSDEISWIASLFDAGILVGTVVGGVVFKSLGRRATMIMGPVAQVAWALLIYFATSPVYLYVARVAAGTAMALNLMFTPIYIGEVTSPDLRGPLTLLAGAGLMIGTLLEYTVGPNVSFKTQAIIGIPPPLAGLLLAVFCMDESPYYLAMVNRYDEMIKVLARLRAAASEDDVKMEAAAIQETVEKQMGSSTTLRETFAEPGTRRAALIVLALTSSTAFLGNATIMTYAQLIFKATGSPLKDDVSVIVMFGVQLLGIAVSAKLVNVAGRRPLLILTLMVSGICLCGVAVFLFLKEAVDVDVSSAFWLPLFCLVTCRFCGGLGASTLPEVLAGELLDQRTKTIVAPLSVVLVSVSAFGMNKMFQPIQEAVGLYAPFVLFSVWNVLTGVFTYFFVPETKGRTLAELQDMLRAGSLQGRKERI